MEIKACDYAHAIFQSALPRGERHGASVEYKPTMTTISIRAPARGATYNLRYIYFSRIFQSALPRGERRVDTNLAFHMFLFQSALPRGERHNMVGYCQSHRDFNPRSREGSDDGTQLSVRYGCYFNPRSREGSDQSHKPRTAILQAFQSALPRGERRCTSSGISVAM